MVKIPRTLEEKQCQGSGVHGDNTKMDVKLLKTTVTLNIYKDLDLPRSEHTVSAL